MRWRNGWWRWHRQAYLQQQTYWLPRDHNYLLCLEGYSHRICSSSQGLGLPTHAPRQVPPLKWTSLLSRGVFLRQSAEKIPLSPEVCREIGSAHGSPRALWVGESLSGTGVTTGRMKTLVVLGLQWATPLIPCLPPLNSDKLVFLYLIFAITRKTGLQYDYYGTFSP